MFKGIRPAQTLVLFIHALIGWGLCGGVIAGGRAITSMQNTLIIHAVAVPIIFGLLSLIYFRFFGFTSPLCTAAIFTAFAIFMDVFIIALFVEKSFVMFTSILGTWIPFGLIFLSTYLVGRLVLQSRTNGKR